MRDLLHPRVLLVLAVLVGACFVNTKFVPHHENSNPILQLFLHLEPAGLVTDAHGSHGDAGAAEEHATEEHGAAEHGATEHGATEHGATEHGATEHGADEHAADAHGHASPYLLAVPMAFLPKAFDMDRVDSNGTTLVLTNLQVFQIAAILLIFICFSGVPSYLRTGRGDVVTRLFAGFALWLRDETVIPVMGKEEGTKWTPYFLAVFFFVLFMNMSGLLPHAATATSSIFVTGAMAATTLVCMLVFGMVRQGPISFWKHLVPHVPIFIWPLMFVVEVVGLVIKPVALMLRLFATMTGGHMVILAFMGLIFFFAKTYGAGPDSPSAIGYAVAPLSVGFGVFVMIIESFVVMLQAYIFTQLSVIFINMAMHPEH
ncbi:MAG: F0F1 ATP synthase subunit A [Planctomycetota bacterium]